MKIKSILFFSLMAVSAVFSSSSATVESSSGYAFGMSKNVLRSMGNPSGLKRGGVASDNSLQLKNSSFHSLSFVNKVGAAGSFLMLSSDKIQSVGYVGKDSQLKDYLQWSMPGYTMSHQVGFPQVPVKVEMIEIPQGAEPLVKIRVQEFVDVPLQELGFDGGYLYPAQEPVSKSNKGSLDFQMNRLAYNSDLFLGDQASAQIEGRLHQPVRIEEVGQMRAQRLGRLVVSPYLYNPVQQKLRIYTRLEFEVYFVNADRQATEEIHRRYASPVYSNLAMGVVNPYGVAASSKETDSRKSGSLRSEILQKPMRYVIVSDPMFKDSLQKFINWKTILGFDVVDVYTDDPEVGKTKESIRAYLKSMYDGASEENPAPDYVLFVGDIDQIPTGYYQGIGWGGSGHFSDLYLCEYTGDHLPDVFYGRMSARSVEDLMPQIDKTMYMERLQAERSSFLDTCVVIAGVDDNFGESHLNPTIDYIHNIYMKDTLSRHGYKYPYPSSHSKADDIVKNINDGTSVVIYTAHGGENNWSDPYIDNNTVNKQFTNKDKYPLMVGNCCLSGKFDVAVCFGEALLRKKDGGAAVYIGATNSTYFDQDVYWAIGYTSHLTEGYEHTFSNTEYGGYDAMYHSHGESFEKWAMTASEIIYAGNMAVEKANQGLVEYYWQVYHVFGDPSYMPYTHKPAEFMVNHAGELYLGETEYRVYTEPYARVSLSQNGKVLGSAMADESGLAIVKLTEWGDVDDVDMSVVLHNYIPYVCKIQVQKLEGKAVMPIAQSVYDMEGNLVNSVMYGTSYKFRYTLKNVGEADVEKMTVLLKSVDDLTFEQQSLDLTEPLASGSELVLEHDFVAKVGADVKDRSLIRYEMEVLCDGESTAQKAKEWSVMAMAPEIEIVGFSIDDSGSSGEMANGVIDYGETVKARVTFRNVGSVLAKSLKATVSTDIKDALELPSKELELGDVEVGKETSVEFSYSAVSYGARYRIYNLIFSLKSLDRTMIDSVASYITPVVETFESGDLTFVNWEADGWKIAQDRVHSGSFSVSSADVTENSGVYTLKVEVEASMDDQVAFHYNTSTELINGSFGDFLHFYIDGKLQGKWAGDENQWKSVSFPVSKGVHTLEWKYVKDDSDKAGEDKVWLDDIRLPIGSVEEITSNQPIENLHSGSFDVNVIPAGDGKIDLRVNSEKSQVVSFSIYGMDGQRKSVLSSGLRVDPGTTYLQFPVSRLTSGSYLMVAEGSSGERYVVKFVWIGR